VNGRLLLTWRIDDDRTCRIKAQLKENPELIEIFLDSSVMPRRLSHPGLAVKQLADLAEATLICIHASTVTVEEWRSQMIVNARAGVVDVHRGLRVMRDQEHLMKLSNAEQLSTLADAREMMLAESDKITREECDKLCARLDLRIIPLDPKDADEVFDRYFSGKPPFAREKHRPDIPDAFIHCAAKRLASNFGGRDIFAVCADTRLAEAFGQIEHITLVRSLSQLIETKEIQEAMTHLALWKAWTCEMREQGGNESDAMGAASPLMCSSCGHVVDDWGRSMTVQQYVEHEHRSTRRVQVS
jgi:hypothetical protein